MSIQDEQSSNWDSNGFNVYANSAYHYEDAALLATLWNIPTMEAKQAIGHKIINQIENLLPEEVQALHKKHSDENDSEEADGLDAETTFNAYANSTYHYEDAELLAKLWDIPVLEAKHRIGNKVINQIEDLLPEEVQALHEKHLNEGDAETPQSESVAAIAERPAIAIKGSHYLLQARVLWSDETPAGGLLVYVYDKDIFNDDFLGKTITSEDGGFDLSFTEKDFKDLFFDRKPDLYFIIRNNDDEELFNTKEYVIKNADEKTTPITLIL